MASVADSHYRIWRLSKETWRQRHLFSISVEVSNILTILPTTHTSSCHTLFLLSYFTLMKLMVSESNLPRIQTCCRCSWLDILITSGSLCSIWPLMQNGSLRPVRSYTIKISRTEHPSSSVRHSSRVFSNVTCLGGTVVKMPLSWGSSWHCFGAGY